MRLVVYVTPGDQILNERVQTHREHGKVICCSLDSEIVSTPFGLPLKFILDFGPKYRNLYIESERVTVFKIEGIDFLTRISLMLPSGEDMSVAFLWDEWDDADQLGPYFTGMHG